MLQIPTDWLQKIEPFLDAGYLAKLEQFIESEYQNHPCTPRRDDIFRALQLTAFADVRVVILGQDPYPNSDFACGLAFSVRKGCKIPMSLQNIFKVACPENPKEQSGDLTQWAKQGVLLLNTALTFSKDRKEHRRIWQPFTKAIFQALAQSEQPKIFMLWGKDATAMEEFISKPHITLTSVHPSPMSARNGFLTCDHFNIANKHLQKPIVWSTKDTPNITPLF